MMHTYKIDVKAYAHVFGEYFRVNTVDTRCMYNAINFYIRNVMTGIQKKPEERTDKEKEAIEYVLAGIKKANERKAHELEEVNWALGELRNRGGMKAAIEAFAVVKTAVSVGADTPFKEPTAKKFKLSYTLLNAVFYEMKHPVYTRMNSQVNQNAIRKCCHAWSSYWSSAKKFKAGELANKPSIPHYIKDEAMTAWWTNQVATLKLIDGKAYIQFVNTGKLFCIGKESMYAGMKFVKVEVCPKHGAYQILVTMDDGKKELQIPEAPTKLLGVDVGVGNFAAVANNFGDTPFIIKGSEIKSRNQWFNKRRAELMSALAAGKDSQHSRKDSPALDALSRNRENFIRDYFYKVSHYICRYAQRKHVDVIVIGHNKGQKQDINMGHINNQNFVCIPYAVFCTVLKYIGAKYGIPVVIREESYTSKASLIDGDYIPTYGVDNTPENKNFSGERVHRGLYKTKDGMVLNADINGAGNIIRKEFPDAFKGQADLSYLWKTTMVVDYRDLYRTTADGIELHTRHRMGTGSKIRHTDRMAKRIEVYEAFDVCERHIYVKDEKKTDTNTKAETKTEQADAQAAA